MTFAEKLRHALMVSGMTRAELADKAGISRPMITNYLKGEYKAKQNNIFKLAKALNISENDLIEDEYVNNNHQELVQRPYIDPLALEIAQMIRERPAARNLFNTTKKATDKELIIAANLLDQLSAPDGG